MLCSFGASAKGVIRFAGDFRSLLPFGVRGNYGILERMRRPMPRKDSNASNRPLRSVASLPEGFLKSNDSAPRPSVHSTFDWEI
jgi:hypothetical protein